MSAALDDLLPGYFRLFQGIDGGFVDMHKTHGKLESRQNIPIALFLAARGERVCLLPVLDLQAIKSPDATRNGVDGSSKCPKAVPPMPLIKLCETLGAKLPGY